MPHITFIHGIANKVEPGRLLIGWLDAIRDVGGPDLLSEGVTTSMCYWADVLYAEPLPDRAGSPEANDEAAVDGSEDVGLAWFEALPADEQRQVLELAAEAGAAAYLRGDVEVSEEPAPAPAPGGVDLERVPLPGPVKRRLMSVFLRDVHHYLWNTEHSPRLGETYRVRDEVRSRAIDALAAAEGNEGGPHIIVSHSLGTVIAYDVLKNVAEAPEVNGLVTLGSPLGLDEVQDRLRPGWTRWDGFPAARVAGPWVNVYDRLDPVCGFDPVLANDFRREGSELVVDVNEPSWGRWRHSIEKYLRGRELRGHLVDLLELG